MVDIIKFGKFKNFEKNKNKKQIILCNTFRSSEKYLNSVKNRRNGDYKRVPNYVINRDGKIINLLPDDNISHFFEDYDINRNSIIICLENLGWLTKTPFNLNYINWIGDIYNGKVFERKWRDKIYWSDYTEEQLNSLVLLCNKLTKKFSIKKKFIGHNTKVDGVKIFNGIVCRSNYDNRYTDISPSFDFENFKKQIENE